MRTHNDLGEDVKKGELMRAVVQDRYGTGEQLRLGDMSIPRMEDDRVLVEVRASSVNAADWHMMTGTPYLVRIQGGWRTPKRTVPGTDLAGVVRGVGKNVRRFEIGDEVYGEVGGGAFAECVAVRERTLARKPANLSFEESAAVPLAAETALQGLRDIGRVQAGEQVLINGASGGVGTFAVQIAKAFGAEVTAVCSTGNVDQTFLLGADRVIDYSKEDFTVSGERFDLIFDIAGNRPWKDLKRCLTEIGRHVMVGGPKGKWLGPVPYLLRLKLATFGRKRSVGWFVEAPAAEDLEFLTELIESDKVKPVIESTYPLAEISEAMQRFGRGHTKAKIVVTVG